MCIALPYKSSMDLEESKSTVSSTVNGSQNGEISEGSPSDGQNRFCGKEGYLRESILTLLTFVGVTVGIVLGFVLRLTRSWSQREVMYISFPGEMFHQMLNSLFIPLITSSLVSAIGSMEISLTGKICLRSLIYYLCTTVFAIIVGVILVIIIRPGNGSSVEIVTVIMHGSSFLTVDVILDLIRNLFPPNIIEASFSHERTHLIPPHNDTDGKLKDPYSWDFELKAEPMTNILGLVVFSIVLGIALASIKETGKPLLDIFIALNDAMIKLTTIIMWIGPVCMVFLLAGKILAIKDMGVVVGQIALYSATVLVGLLLHSTVTLPLIFFVVLRKQPFTYIGNMAQALITAFATSSSSETLPVTLKCAEEKNGVNPHVSRFIFPVGATVNMDGTALNLAAGVIFIAQIRKVPLHVGNVISISITTVAASIGTAGLPEASIATLIMLLNVLGLRADDVAIILVVDWLLDRFRTVVNVLGDAVGAAVVEQLSKKDLQAASSDDSHNPNI